MTTNNIYTTAEIIRIARCHKNINWLIVWGLIAGLAVGLIAGFLPQIESQILPIIIQVAFGIVAAFLIYQLAVALKASNPWIWALVVFLPCGGLIVMLILSFRGTKTLKSQGIRVGLMGAKMDDLPSDDSSSPAVTTPISSQQTPESAAEDAGWPSDKSPMSDDSKKETTHLPPLPENVSYIKTLCPLCDGSIEFPADALGQRADCPHCHKTFVLGSVTAPAQTEKVQPSLNQPSPALNQMNVNQKILTGIALLAFIVSVCNAPWEVTSISTIYEDHRILGKTIMYSPVWEQPNQPSYGGEPRYEYRLLLSPLFGVWIAIGVLYTGSFFLLKNTPSILIIIKPVLESINRKR